MSSYNLSVVAIFELWVISAMHYSPFVGVHGFCVSRGDGLQSVNYYHDCAYILQIYGHFRRLMLVQLMSQMFSVGTKQGW